MEDCYLPICLLDKHLFSDARRGDALGNHEEDACDHREDLKLCLAHPRYRLREVNIATTGRERLNYRAWGGITALRTRRSRQRCQDQTSSRPKRCRVLVPKVEGGRQEWLGRLPELTKA